MNNRISYISILLLLVLISCGNNTSIEKEGAIPKEKMIEVMTELELTQALIKLKASTQDSINEDVIFNEVYKEFNINEEVFNKSLTIYCKDPVTLQDMYSKVMENLTKKQSEHQGK